MSTRGVIARQQGDGWEGVYQHSDSSPTWLGKAIWDKLHNGYNLDIEQFLVDVVDGHRKGWSSFPDSCYCHDWGRQGDSDMIETNQDTDPLFIEWVYVLCPRSNTMAIFNSIVVGEKPPDHIASHHCEASKVIRLNGSVETDPDSWYIHQFVTSVRLDGTEPDWETIEQA